MPSWTFYALLTMGPLAFGVLAAILLVLLLDVAIYHASDKDAERNLKRGLTVLGWFVGNGAPFLVTLWLIDQGGRLNNPQDLSIAFLCYLFGFGAAGSRLAMRRLHTADQARFDQSHPDLTVQEANVIRLMLGQSLSAEQVASRMGITVEAVRNHYTNALRKMSRRSRQLPPPTS